MTEAGAVEQALQRTPNCARSSLRLPPLNFTVRPQGTGGRRAGVKTMHIYQPFDLVLGLLMLPVGLLCLGQDIHRIATRTFRNSYADWRSVTLSAWFVSGGPAHISKASDPRHQESHQTTMLQAVALSVLAVVLIANGIAWLVRRRQQAEQTGPEAAHPGV